MYDELTKMDIEKMQEEIEYRKVVLRPQLLEEVKTARAFGDLSENYEYKEAKRLKNKNEGRIRYLTNMIKTAKIIEDISTEDTVGLFDIVECYMDDIDEVMTVQLATNVRINVSEGIYSKDSPIGRALLGKKVGDKVEIESPDGGYVVEIKSITKSYDDGSAPILSY
ncbi:MAG: GreA/GreB family elongation factor [Clostridia bacterium]|nr:GreA/GreB family elongation factor [Clostridia bacterium]